MTTKTKPQEVDSLKEFAAQHTCHGWDGLAQVIKEENNVVIRVDFIGQIVFFEYLNKIRFCPFCGEYFR